MTVKFSRAVVSFNVYRLVWILVVLPIPVIHQLLNGFHRYLVVSTAVIVGICIAVVCCVFAIAIRRVMNRRATLVAAEVIPTWLSIWTYLQFVAFLCAPVVEWSYYLLALSMCSTAAFLGWVMWLLVCSRRLSWQDSETNAPPHVAPESHLPEGTKPAHLWDTGVLLVHDRNFDINNLRSDSCSSA